MRAHLRSVILFPILPQMLTVRLRTSGVGWAGLFYQGSGKVIKNDPSITKDGFKFFYTLHHFLDICLNAKIRDGGSSIGTCKSKGMFTPIEPSNFDARHDAEIATLLQGRGRRRRPFSSILCDSVFMKSLRPLLLFCPLQRKVWCGAGLNSYSYARLTIMCDFSNTVLLG